MIASNPREQSWAIVYGTAPGVGGLGHSVSSAITALAGGKQGIVALGPQSGPRWSLGDSKPLADWRPFPGFKTSWLMRQYLLRRSGTATMRHDEALGTWAASILQQRQPTACYAFTQVALESLRWCREYGIPSMLDNPNGHIRNFQKICEAESTRWFGKRFHGHPTDAMVRRVEEEYELATQIRVYSQWGKESMMRYGVPEDKLCIVRQIVNISHFQPAPTFPSGEGPLRLCFVGSVDVRKGFVYLLRAMRKAGADRFHLRIVGATGDRHCANLLKRETAGLQVESAPGDPLPVYQSSEVLVVPTLEDGLPFTLVEGMACGLPAIVTSEAGAAECVSTGRNGWVVAAGDVDALASALETALQERSRLREMGRQARADLERYAGNDRLQELRESFRTMAAQERQGCRS